MVDLDVLAGRARRSLERGRLLMAARIAWLVLPMAVAAILAGSKAAPCACLGLALLVAAALPRWRGRAGVDSVRVGMSMGIIPFAVALLLPVSLAAGDAICIAAGTLAGLGVALRARREWRSWLVSTGVAGLAAGLGALRLGAGGLLVALALVVAALVAWWPRPRQLE